MIAAAVKAFDTAEPMDGWREPDLGLIHGSRPPAPEFPVPLLGPWGEWVEQRAQGASAPVDFVAIGLLAAVGAALGNVRWPLCGSAWSEPPILWACAVAPPSAGKSPALARVQALVSAAEGDMASGFDADLRAYEADALAADERRKVWEGNVRDAARDGLAIPPEPVDAMRPRRPERPRIIVQDATPERLAELSAALPRGLLMYRDELAGWFDGFGRYDKGGAGRAFWVEAYGGRPYRVDRKTDASAAGTPRLTIGVLGGTQPDKLAGLLRGEDDGLVSRFLWAFPSQVPRFTLLREHCGGAHDTAEAAFRRLTCLAMAKGEDELPQPKSVPFEPGALDQLELFANELRSAAAHATGYLAGAMGKAPGHVVRLSAIQEFLWWAITPDTPEPTTISEVATLRAIGMVDSYFLPMAERTLAEGNGTKEEREASALARFLLGQQCSRFNARELRRTRGCPLQDAAAMDRACAALADAAIVRPVADGEGPGRKRKTFEVNPALWESAP